MVFVLERLRGEHMAQTRKEEGESRDDKLATSGFFPGNETRESEDCEWRKDAHRIQHRAPSHRGK